MDIWKYEQTDRPTEWEEMVFGPIPQKARELNRVMWAVSVRGRVFTGFKTRREAREYGKRIEVEGEKHLPPAVADISQLPEALAAAYRTAARRDGYVYDPERLAWVKALGDAITSGFYDDETYPEAGEAAREGFEPEIALLLEMLEEHMETILAAVRLSEEEPSRIRARLQISERPRRPRPMASGAPVPPFDKIEPFEHYPYEVRLGETE